MMWSVWNPQFRVLVGWNCPACDAVQHIYPLRKTNRLWPDFLLWQKSAACPDCAADLVIAPRQGRMVHCVSSFIMAAVSLMLFLALFLTFAGVVSHWIGPILAMGGFVLAILAVTPVVLPIQAKILNRMFIVRTL